jgi:hypothetical protein
VLRFVIAAATFLLSAPWPAAARLHTISGCVKDDKGAPVPAAIIFIEELEGLIKEQVAADARGCFKEDGLPDGSYEVRAQRDGVPSASKQILLDYKKGSLTIDLQVKPKLAPATRSEPPMVNLRLLASSSTLGTADEAKVKSIVFSAAVVNAGDPAIATIVLDKPAPAGGTTIRLSASNPVLALVPETVDVPTGAWTATVPITTSRVRGPSDVHLVLRVGAGSSELTIRSHTRLTVELTGNGSGSVVSTPAGILCPKSACTHAFTEGESIQLQPQPNPDSAFTGFSGDCAKEGTVVISGPMRCAAAFSLK